MKKITIGLLILFSASVFASQFSIILKTNIFQIGERISITVSVLNDAGLNDTNYSGYIRLSSDNPLLKIKGKNPDGSSADINNQGNILISKGVSGQIFCYSYNAGNFILKAEEWRQNSSVPVTEKEISYTVLPAKKRLLLNEIMSKTSKDADYEYIEIYNNSDSDISVSNLSVYYMPLGSSDAPPKTNKTLLSSIAVSVPLHNCLLLTRNSDALLSIFPQMNNNHTIIANLNHNISTSCQIIIYADNSVEDSFEYTLGSGEGYNYSLERISFNWPSYDENNWQFSASPSPAGAGFYGTPGYENSRSLYSEKIIFHLNIPEQIISKTGTLNFQYSINSSGKITVYLLNSSGTILKTLIKEKEIAGDTVYSENYGLRNLPSLKVGLYILKAQFINETSGISTQSSKIFVIRN